MQPGPESAITGGKLRQQRQPRQHRRPASPQRPSGRFTVEPINAPQPFRDTNTEFSAR